MNSFRNQRLRNHALPMSTAWLFNDIAEARGKQELFTRYYECLNHSSQRWHEGKPELTPWFNFLLVIIRRGYTEFENRAGQVKAPRGAKAGLVVAAIREQLGDFRLTHIEHACPGVGREWIRSLLTDLKATGEVACQGKGPAARWRNVGSKGSNP